MYVCFNVFSDKELDRVEQPRESSIFIIVIGLARSWRLLGLYQ